MTVREYCHTLLEVEGFTKSDAKDFVKRYFKGEDDFAKELLDRLDYDEPIQDLARNPLNTALLCLLCEDFQGKLPESRTLLYLGTVECVLRRYRRRMKLPEADQDLGALYQIQLKDLDHITLEGLKNDNMYFEQSALHGFSTNVIIGFGFLSVEVGRSKRRPSRCYRFLHRSFQEFFAAFYLSCQPLDEEILRDSLVDDRYLTEFQLVLMFTIGMLAERSKEKAKALIASIASQVNLIGSSEYLFLALRCINECRKEQSTFDKELAQDLGSLLEVSWFSNVGRMDKGVLAALVEVLRTNSTLTWLELIVSGVEHVVGAALGKALEENSTLTELDLIECGICNKGAATLAQAVEKNSTLTRLNLACNEIDDEGAVAVAKALEENSTLTELNLAYCKIGDPGAATLAKALEKNSTLTELKLSENEIGDPGVAALAKALEKNSILTELKLSENEIGDEGAATLAKALKDNSSLTLLEFSENEISDELGAALAKAVKKNKLRS